MGRGLGCLLEEDVELQRRGLIISGKSTKKKRLLTAALANRIPWSKGENIIFAGHGVRCSVWYLALRTDWEGCWLQKYSAGLSLYLCWVFAAW